MRDEEQISRAVVATVEKFGGIDILVNNASAINLSRTEDVTSKTFHLMMDLNAKGTFFW